MLQTLTALFAAHVLADYILQWRGLVAGKRKPSLLVLHALIVLAASLAATGQFTAWPVYALATAHLAIDAVKTWALPDTAGAHLADQGAHLASIFVVAALFPDLWASGAWGAVPNWLLPALLVVAGAVYAIWAGGYAVGILMTPYAHTAPEHSLPEGGRMIGLLERTLIYVLVLAGQVGAIGFLIAAKSVMRFETAKEDRRAAEYVIIGTLASFAWALIVALGVTMLLPGLVAAAPAP